MQNESDVSHQSLHIATTGVTARVISSLLQQCYASWEVQWFLVTSIMARDTSWKGS